MKKLFRYVTNTIALGAIMVAMMIVEALDKPRFDRDDDFHPYL